MQLSQRQASLQHHQEEELRQHEMEQLLQRLANTPPS
jgi:hypothetical protein